MRLIWSCIFIVALVLASCRPRGADAPPSELWLRIHCAGTSALTNQPDAATLAAIGRLPATAELRDALAQQIVTSLQQVLLRTTNAPTPDAADLLKPLLDDTLEREFVFECHGRSNAPTTWLLAVKLGGGPGNQPPPVPIAGSVTNRARFWETNYRALVARLDLGEVKKFNARSFGGWHVTQPDKRVIDFLEVGHWAILGLGTDRRPMMGALERANEKGHPVAPLGGDWLRAEGDLARFAKSLPLGDAVAWPRFALNLTLKNSNVVANTKLTFPGSLPASLPAWNVPTNLVQDPVISFTALRGMRDAFARMPFYQRLALTNSPDQMFFWAQAQIPFQSHVAMPLPGSGETLHEIARRIPIALGTNMQNRAFGEIRWATNRVDLIWAGLPIVVPFLRDVNGPDGSGFLFGGLFPPRDTKQPLPPELLGQLARTNLVYYDWEITQDRLNQWRQLWQIWALATFKAAYAKPIAQARWLEAIGPHLGNTITEVTRTGANELSVTRKSHLGLTGVELLWLARVLDGFVSGPAPEPLAPGAGKLPAPR